MNTDDPQLRAPDGTSCTRHPDRPAHYLCPRCGARACSGCWRPSQSICEPCANRESAGEEAAPEGTPSEPPPFENLRLAASARLSATLKAAFFPGASATSFARARLESAVVFFLITVLPASALAGVIPFTKTLRFGPGLQLELIGAPKDMQVVLDVARAMLMQITLDSVTLLCVALPFVTLARSYGRAGADRFAGCMLLYRAWLLPGASLSAYLVFWIVPSTELAAVLSLAAYVPFLVLLTYAMWFTARLTCGIEWNLALVVCGVPWVLAILVSGVVAPIVFSLFGLIPPGVDPGSGIPV